MPLAANLAAGGANSAAALQRSKANSDLQAYDKGCSDIPFDEIKKIMGDRFNNVDKSLDRNLNAIENNSKAINRNLDAINNVGGKTDRNFRAIENNLKGINRNYDAIERNYGAINRNFQGIKTNYDAIKENYNEIRHVSGQVSTNLGAIERNFDQLKINEGEIKLVGGKVDRNYGAIKHISSQVDRNLNTIRESLKAITTNYNAIKQNYDEIKHVSWKVDRNFDTIIENYYTTKHNLEAINRNYLAINTIENKIDLNLSVMLSGFQYIVDKIDEVKNELNQALKTSKVENAISQIIAFFEVFSTELDGTVNLSEDRLIEKLEAKDGTLSILKSVRNPTKGYLYNDLKSIIRQGLAVPKSSDDNTAFVVLDLLYYGTELYTSVMYSLIRSHVYLATYFYQKNDVEKYNQYLSELEITSKGFVDSLNGIGINRGLLNEVKIIFDQVKELEFIKKEKEYLSDILLERINNISSISLNLLELIKYLPKSPPVFKVRLDFSKSNINTPIGRWKDGDEVSYALHCQKSNGTYTKVSNWVSYEIQGSANPILDLGVVSDGEKRSIFRKFNNNKPELVGYIEDSKQSYFRDINKDLYNAVLKPNEKVALNEIAILVKDGADINEEYGNEGHILNVAAKQGNYNIISALILNGADIDSRDTDGNTPIHTAVQHGYNSVIEILIQNGADVNIKNNLNYTPVHVAADTGNADILNLLIKNGASINSTTWNGDTPLHIASEFGRDNIVNLLSSGYNANVNSTSALGFTPLHLASMKGNDLVVKSLLKNSKVDINSKTDNGFTPLHLASVSGNLSIIKLLAAQDKNLRINHQSTEGLSSLHLSIFFKKETVAAELLEIKGIDVNIKTKAGLTPLHIAVITNQSGILSSLLSNNASPEEHDYYDNTPLHFAAEQGNLEMVKILVNVANSNLNVRRKDGRTPFHLAIISKKLDLVSFFISKGVRIGIKDKWGISDLTHAIQTGTIEIVRILADAYKDKDYNFNEALYSAAYNGKLDILQYLVQSKFQILNSNNYNSTHTVPQYSNHNISKHLKDETSLEDLKDNHGNTLIHFAALGGNMETIEYLTGMGLKPNTTNSYNIVPLHMASFGAHINSVKYFIREDKTKVVFQAKGGNFPIHFLAASNNKEDPHNEILNYITKSQVNIDIPNEEGYTPILEFARLGKWSAVQFLLKKGVNKNVTSSKGESILHFASRDGNENMVELITQATSNIVNTRDRNGWSPIFWAAGYGHYNVVKLLTEKNASHNVLDNAGMSILHAAVLSNNLMLVKYLVEEKKINVNLSDSVSRSPLHLAAQYGYLELVEYLVKSGAARNSLDNNHSTPLLNAASNKKWNIVKYLIKNSANIKIANNQGNTLIHKCAEGGALEIIKSFENNDFNVRNNRGETPLHLATTNARFDIVEYLVDHKGVSSQVKDNQGNTPLHNAALIDDFNSVKYLIDKGSDPSVTNTLGKNPCDLCSDLNVAKYFIDQQSLGYDTNPFNGAKNNTLGTLKYLLEQQRLDPNIVDSNGKTLLHHAAERGHLGIVKYLIENKKTDINTKDSEGNTPLYWAASSDKLSVVQYLVDSSADFSIQDKNGNTPLHIAEASGKLDVVKYLREKSFSNRSIFDAAKNGDLDAIKYFIENKKTDINAKDDEGNTPLHKAASSGKLDVVKYLADNGSDFNIQNKNGNTPLHIAEASGKLDVVKYLREKSFSNRSIFDAAKNGDLDAIKYFIENKKTDINAKDNEGNTPLYLTSSLDIARYLIEQKGVRNYNDDVRVAATNGYTGLVKYLVDVKNASFNIKDNHGNTPLHNAAKKGNLDIVKYFIKDKHVDIEIKGENDNTPLIWAAEQNKLNVVEYLVKSGANINTKNKYGVTAIHYAINKGYSDIVTYLKSLNRNRRSVKSSQRDKHSVEENKKSSIEELSYLKLDNEKTVTGKAIDNKSTIHNNKLETENFNFNFNFNGLLLLSTLLSKLPIVGKFFPKIKLPDTNSTIFTSISLPESMDYAADITQEFEKILNKTATHLSISKESLNLNPVLLSSEIAHLFRNGSKTSELSKVLYSYAKEISRDNNEFLNLIKAELPNLEKTYELKFNNLQANITSLSINNIVPNNITTSSEKEIKYLPSSSMSNVNTLAVANNSMTR